MPRQLAELLQLSVEEVCADFDAMLRHDWRPSASPPRSAILRVAQRADAELAGRPGGQLRSGAEGAPHRVLLAFDGHCCMYRAVKRVLERRRRACSAGARRGRPCQEWRRFDAADLRGRSGSSWPLARAPKGALAARRSTAETEAGHQDPRAAEEHECCGGGARRSTRSTGRLARFF